MTLIYHVCRKDEWEAAQAAGAYGGSSQDKEDGFIHFSGGDTLVESVAKHRASQDGLVLLTVDDQVLGAALKWEPSRGGLLFPHLYGELPVSAVIQADDLALSPDGSHVFPDF
ncbi:MAG: DUF952 domain-containing protein [Rhodospirillaceae bacterium]|jgi:uncharacterized protein (DUF952 family)